MKIFDIYENRQNRLLAFFDAVLAIAITVLALQIDIPELGEINDAGRYEFFMMLTSYFMSFIAMGSLWYVHTSFFSNHNIMNNKKTFLLINTMQLAQGDDADELRHWLNDQYAIRDDKVRGVTSLYERLGVRQLAEDAITHYNDRAVAAFSQLKISDDDKSAFIALANRLSGRNY